MRGVVIETDEHPLAEAWAKSVLERFASDRIA